MSKDDLVTMKHIPGNISKVPRSEVWRHKYMGSVVVKKSVPELTTPISKKR